MHMVQETNTTQETQEIPAMRAGEDLKTAVLVVSVVVNLFVFITWLAIQVTTRYDDQIANFIFNR